MNGDLLQPRQGELSSFSLSGPWDPLLVGPTPGADSLEDDIKQQANNIELCMNNANNSWTTVEQHMNNR